MTLDKKYVELMTEKLARAYWAKIEYMEILVYALNNNMPYDLILKDINNIGSKCDYLTEVLNKLDK